MSYPSDLLSAAGTLLTAKPETEANLRRAVSTAYYALFHLLIETACSKWPERQRIRLARQFEHKRMREASEKIAQTSSRSTLESDQEIIAVARTFATLQEKRHQADYNFGAEFSFSDVEELILSVRSVFSIWEQIKDEPTTQDYLFSLLFKDRP